MAQQIEIEVVCPECESKRYINNGRDGNWIYRKCLECGYSGKTLRMTQAELTRRLEDNSRVA